MRKYLVVLFLILVSLAVNAQQQPVNTSTFNGLPPAGTITGNELVPIDQLGVTKKATTSQLTLGSMVLGIPSGGTGLTSVGPSGTCLQSNGSSLLYGTCGSGGGGGGSPPGGSTGSIQYNAGGGLFGGYSIGAGLSVVGGNTLISTSTGGATPAGAKNDVQINNGAGNFAPLQADTQAAYAAHNNISSGISYDPRDAAYGAICAGYNTFATDGSTTTFSYSIPFTGSSNIDNTNFFVFYEPSSGFGSATILNTTQFTVTGVNSGIGGTITLNSAPPSGNTLIVVHDDSAGLVAASVASAATGGYIEVPDGCTIYGSQSLGTRFADGANVIGQNFSENYNFNGSGNKPFIRVIAPTGFAPAAGINISNKFQQFFEGFEITSNVPGSDNLGFLDVPVLIGTVGNNGAGGGKNPGIVVQHVTFASGSVDFGAPIGGNSQYIFSALHYNNFLSATACVNGPLSDFNITDNDFSQCGGFGSYGSAGGLVIGPQQGAAGFAGAGKLSRNRFEFNLEGVVVQAGSIISMDDNQFDSNTGCGLDLRTSWNGINITGGWFRGNARGSGSGNFTAGEDAHICFNSGSGSGGLHVANVNFYTNAGEGASPASPAYVLDFNSDPANNPDVTFDGGDAKFILGANGASVMDFAIYHQPPPPDLKINVSGQSPRGGLASGAYPGQVRGLPSNQWSGINIFGDNGSNNLGNVPLIAGWGSLVAKQMGVGPTYKTVNVNTIFDCDVVNFEVGPIKQPTTSNNVVSGWLAPTADSTFGAGFYQDHLTDTQRCHMGGLTWLTVPTDYKTYAQALSGVTTSGAWVTSSIYGPYGYATSENADTMSLTTTTNGGPIYLWYLMKAGDGGTFTYNLDGGTNTTIATQGNNSFSFPNTGNSNYTGCCSGIPQTLGGQRIPILSAGSHTINVAVSSTTSATNTVTIFGIGTPPGKPYSSKYPVVVQGSQLSLTTTFQAAANAFSSAYQGQDAQLLSDGLGTLYANVANYFNLATDTMLYNGTTLNLSVEGQSHIAQAFTGVIQPIRRENGSIDPRDFGAACNTQFYDGQGVGPTWLLSTTSGSNVVSLSNSSNTPYYWQPGTATQNGGGDEGKKICIMSWAGPSNNVGPCTYIASVDTSTNKATLGATMAASSSSASVEFGGYPSNPNDPSTAQDDMSFFASAGQAAILNGGKVHVPTNCMVHGAWPTANVVYEGNNGDRTYFNGVTRVGTDQTPSASTILFCGLTGYQDDNPVCADVSHAVGATFKNILMAAPTFPYLAFAPTALTAVGIGYAQSAGDLNAGSAVFTDNMSYYQLPVDVGEAFGYNIVTNFTGNISGNTLNVLSVTSTNMNKTYGDIPAGFTPPDAIALGRTITGVGIPSGETITSVPPQGGVGAYGLSLSATVTTENMATVANNGLMEFHDRNSEYEESGIGINGDLTDSQIDSSICSGSFMYYCWYLGPALSFTGNGANHWNGGRMEELGVGAFVCDGCVATQISEVEFQFQGNIDALIKNNGTGVTFSGGMMQEPGGSQSVLGSIVVQDSSSGINATGVNVYAINGHTGKALIATATGFTGDYLSVDGGIVTQNHTAVANFAAGGVPAHYRQATVGWPYIDTSQSFLSSSTSGQIGMGTRTPTAGVGVDMLSLTTSSNSSLGVPKGTSTNRPTVGVNGMLRYNTSLNTLEAFSNGAWTSLVAVPPSNYIGGYSVLNDTTTPNSVIDINPGSATSNDGTALISVSIPYTKTTGSWAVGSANGCLDTGSIASSTYYNMFSILRTDTNVLDYLCSTSALSPVVPANYNKIARLNCGFKTDGSSHIIPLTQNGDACLWQTPTLDINTALSTTASQFETLNVATGVKVQPIISYSMSANGNAALLFSPDTSPAAVTTTTPFAASPGYTFLASSTSGIENSVSPLLITNTAGQVGLELALSTTTTVTVMTQGWKEIHVPPTPTLAQDFSSTTSLGATTTIATAGFSTNYSNELVVAGINLANGFPYTVSSVVSTAGISWTKRVGLNWGPGGSTSRSEEWYGLYPSPTSDTLTLTYSSATPSEVSLTGIVGANPSAPFDTHAGLPATGNTGSSITATVSTNHPRDYLWTNATAECTTSPISPTYFQNLLSYGIPGLIPGIGINDYYIAPSILSSFAITYGVNGCRAGVIVDAIQPNGL